MILKAGKDSWVIHIASLSCHQHDLQLPSFERLKWTNLSCLPPSHYKAGLQEAFPAVIWKYSFPSHDLETTMTRFKEQANPQISQPFLQRHLWSFCKVSFLMRRIFFIFPQLALGADEATFFTTDVLILVGFRRSHFYWLFLYQTSHRYLWLWGEDKWALLLLTRQSITLLTVGKADEWFRGRQEVKDCNLS